MARNAMRKNLRQSIFRSLGRYIAIVLIIALGCCLFIGLLVTRKDMLATGSIFTGQTGMFDFRIISTYGWEEEQVQKAAQLDGVADAEGVIYQDLIVTREGDNGVYRFYNIPQRINQVLLRGGRMPQNDWECLADGYFCDDSILGTQVTLTAENDEDAFENMTYQTYTVVGYVASPLYMDPNRGTTTVGTGALKGYFYIPIGGFTTDYYTQIDLTLKTRHPIYSIAYDDHLDEMTDGLEAQAELLGQERFDSIKQEAEEEYQEGYQEYQDGLQEYYDGVDEFETELADARQELEDAQELIDRTNYTLNRAEEQIEEAKDTLISQEKALADAEAQLITDEQAARDGLAQAEAGIAQLESKRDEILDGISPLTMETAPAALDTLNSTIALIESGMAPPFLAEQYDTLVEQRDGLQMAISGYNTIMTELGKATALRDQLKTAIEVDIPAGYQTIADGKAQIVAAWEEIDAQSLNIYAGRKELEKAREDLAQGWLDYEEGKREGEQELADAWAELEEGRQELADARKEIDDLEPVEVFVLDRNTNVGYNSLNSSANILAGVSRILPVFFLLVASLVCITTMTRMIDEERTQIGTLKALGYSNGSIISKYLFYAGSASVLGSILGAVAGCTVIPQILWIAYSSMLYLQPQVVLTVDWPLCIGVGAVCVGMMLFVTWYCCRKTLEEVPAELIRPKAPDPGKKLLLEYLPFWKHISFLNKVTIRNIFRYRQRLAMMLVGIGGCTSLLVTGFGLRNSLVGVVDYQYDFITTQHMEVYLDGHQDETAREDFVLEFSNRLEDVLFLHQSNVTLDTGSTVSEVSMVVADQELTRMVNLNSGEETVPLPGKDEVLLSVGVAQNTGIRVGDTVILRDADMRTLELTVSGIYENHISNYAIVSPQTYEGQLGVPADIQMAYIRAAEGEDHYLLAAAMTERDNVLNVSVCADFASMITDLMEALDMLVWVIVICAGMLAAIVLYNLTNINITERIREIATIKVLGFKAGETAAYVFKENVALTVAGSILGLGLGKLLLMFVLQQIKVDLIWFRSIIHPQSYWLSIILTMVCAVVVNFVFYFKLEKINMAEALKSVE